MALDASALSALIKTALDPTPVDVNGMPIGPLGPSMALDVPALDELCNAIATSVVDHIKAAGVVTVPSGVPVATTGTAAAQTGATTAPALGTIT